MRDATRQALARAGVPLVVRRQFLGNRWAPQTAHQFWENPLDGWPVATMATMATP